MAVTLKHQTQKALSLYSYMDVNHPLILAYSDYVFAKSNALPYSAAKARLKRELALEAHITSVLEAAPAWDYIHGYLPSHNEKRGAA